MSFSFYPFSSASSSETVSVAKSPVPFQCPLPDVVITMDPTCNHWAFYFQSLAYPSPSVGSHQLLCVRLIAFQKLQVVTLMVHIMAFLAGKVAALHLDNSTAKACLYNQGGTFLCFSSRQVCHILTMCARYWGEL